MFDFYTPSLVGGANLNESGWRCFNDKQILEPIKRL